MTSWSVFYIGLWIIQGSLRRRLKTYWPFPSIRRWNWRLGHKTEIQQTADKSIHRFGSRLSTGVMAQAVITCQPSSPVSTIISHTIIFKSSSGRPLWKQDSGNCMIVMLRVGAALWLKKSTWQSRSTIGAWPSRVHKRAASPPSTHPPGASLRGIYWSHFKTSWLSAGRGLNSLCTSSRIQWCARYWGESDYNNTLSASHFSFTFIVGTPPCEEVH